MTKTSTILALALLLLATPLRAERVLVFAAASLTDALTALEPAFEAATGHDLVLSFAGSAALARQIRFGAPADLYISAQADWMDLLQAEGRIVEGTRQDLLSNSLVLIAPGPAPADAAPPVLSADTPLATWLGNGRLALALTEAVPAGIYARAALEHLGQWEALAPRVVEADNVRAALALVALGEAALGITYATDARAEPRVHVVATIPPESHPPIRYPIARVAGADRPAARAALDFLTGLEARAVYAAQGFTEPAP